MVRWTRAAAFARPLRSVARVRWLSVASPAAQQWREALAAAPCLVCGGEKRSAHAASRLPLTCSVDCERVAVDTKADVLRVFQQIHDDLDYTTSDDAKTLLTHVLTRDRRAPQQGASAASWEAFTQQFTRDAQWLEDPRAVRLVSAAYTFVSTLSSFLPVVVGDRERVHLHVVGARAEAMMPRPIWEELVDAYPRKTFEIQLIGDHVVRFPHKVRAAAEVSRDNLRLETYTGLYHQVVSTTDALRNLPDAYVLFNPGIGHPKLRASWRPTIEMILRSGKPALLTSFSRRDQERDVDALRDLGDELEVAFVVAPRENAFRSRCFQLDPSDVYAPIQTNRHVMIVCGQATQH